MNIIFDLDGTLIDSKYRLYNLFQDMVPESFLSFDDYWLYKKNKISNEEILKNLFLYNDKKVKEFRFDWMALIESKKYLKFDQSFHGLIEFLELNFLEHDLYICTNRQFIEPTINQLKGFGLLKFFKKILVTEQKNPKNYILSREIRNLSSKDWIVGDTGEDIKVGQILKVNTCAVLSGFLNYGSLVKYRPNIIINSVLEFKPNSSDKLF